VRLWKIHKDNHFDKEFRDALPDPIVLDYTLYKFALLEDMMFQVPLNALLSKIGQLAGKTLNPKSAQN
jgi:hypothetical protein